MICSSHAAVATLRPRPVVWATTLLALLLIGALPGIAGAQPRHHLHRRRQRAVPGFSGDGIPAATLAGLNYPYGLAFDATATSTSPNTAITASAVDIGDGSHLDRGGRRDEGRRRRDTPATQASRERADRGRGRLRRQRRTSPSTTSHASARLTAQQEFITTAAGTGTYGYNGDGIPRQPRNWAIRGASPWTRPAISTSRS